MQKSAMVHQFILVASHGFVNKPAITYRPSIQTKFRIMHIVISFFSSKSVMKEYDYVYKVLTGTHVDNLHFGSESH